jgi:DNA-binding NarL/FixJ family response regulator
MEWFWRFYGRFDMAAGEQLNMIDRDLSAHTIAIVEKRTLFRECIARCLKEDLGCAVVTFSNFESWRDAFNDIHPSMIVIGISGAPGDHRDEHFQETIRQFTQAGKGPPVVVLSDTSEFDHIAASLKAGARGFVPTDSSLSVAVGAMRLVLVGGVFAPAEALLLGALPTA